MMSAATVTSIIIIAVLTTLLVLSVIINFRMVKIITTAEEKIEESLDIIDECYSELYKVTQIPLFSDDPVVRNVVMLIKRSRDSLLLIANKISLIENEDE